MKDEHSLIQFGITRLVDMTPAAAVKKAQALLQEEGYSIGDGEWQIESDTQDDASGGLVVLLEVDDYCWLDLEDAGIVELQTDEIEIVAEMP